MTSTRRQFLLRAAAAGAGTALAPVAARGRAPYPTRPIPRTGEPLPVIGLGSTKAVSRLPERGPDELRAVVRSLLDGGGKVIDTWSRDAELDRLTGEALRPDGLIDDVFLATKVDASGAAAGRAVLERTERLYGRTPDLAQVISLRDLATQWRNLREWQAAGRARYVGATTSSAPQHGELAAFMRAEHPDFVQVNYSVIETAAESSVLPLAADLGVAVLVNRPFMNGGYFARVRGKQLPGWAAAFDCRSWAQFSLKYILAHPAVTCVLTETTKPAHLRENLGAARGPLPDAAARRRMREVFAGGR